MCKPTPVLLLALAAWACCQSSALAITIATVPVGDVGNAADPATGYGSVNYAYSIGTYDVTVGQYTTFLNSVAATDPYGIYNSNMARGTLEGILQSGSSGSYTYSVIGSTENDPITYETWGDAARFANWLSNNQPTGPEGMGTTETGSYTLNGATTATDLNNVTRNSDATWVIPTEDEWYKAAYYQPAAQGGPASNYWDYATRSNTVPTSQAPVGGADSANFYGGASGFALTGSTTFNSSVNYLTPVGAYTHSSSFFGTFDQTGDVYNWNETLIVNPVGNGIPVTGTFRGNRGGSWADNSSHLPASTRGFDNPAAEVFDYTFRVALVATPEPSTAVLSFIACGTLWWWRKRFRK
jgi:formylglycine-generating enzyme required for sulfatase activity